MTMELKWAPWYNKEIESLNERIWTPSEMPIPNNVKFNSKIIEFSSFKNDIFNKLNNFCNKDDINRFKIMRRYYINILAKILNDKTTNYKMYMEYINTKEPNYANSNDYKEDNNIKNFKEITNNIEKVYDKLSQEYKKEQEKFEQLATQNLKIVNINVNNYQEQYNKITKLFHTKMLALIKKQKKYTDNYNNYITVTYNNKLFEENITNYLNDNIRNEYYKQLSIFKAKNHKLITKYNQSIKMINKVIRSYKMKVRFNSEQKGKIFKWMDESDKVYNYCVNLYNTDNEFPSNFKGGKMYIFNKLYVKGEPKAAPYDLLSYTIKVFYENLSSNYSSLENKTKTHFEMKPINNNKNRTVTIISNCIGPKGIYKTLLGINNTNKNFNNENIACDCKLTYNRTTKKFYLYVPQYVECKETNHKKKPICAIDPGEKVFATYYSLDDYGFIGNDIRKPILNIQSKIKKYQRLLSQTINNGKKCNKKNKKGKSINRAKIKKKIKRLFEKISGIVNELHKKAANYLCSNYNIILIPEFQTQNMVSKSDISKQTDLSKKQNKLNKNIIIEQNKDNINNLRHELKNYKRKSRLNERVKFVLNHQAHYKFRQHLLSKAKEYGCLCIIVTEEFTSQLCGNCGILDSTYINRMKICKHCNYKINRDVNGARNILLKYISNYIKL
jgi:transposase